MRIRVTHEHYNKLLTGEERQYLNREQVFQPFTGLNPVQYNPFTLPLWNAAVAQYSKSIEPIEDQIALKLRERFSNTKAKSFQVITCLNCILILDIRFLFFLVYGGSCIEIDLLF